MVAYPAIPEGLQETVRLLLGSSIYKPQVFPAYLSIREVKDFDWDKTLYNNDHQVCSSRKFGENFVNIK